MKKRDEPRNDFERLEGHFIHEVRKSLKKKSHGDFAFLSLVDLYRNEMNKLKQIAASYEEK